MKKILVVGWDYKNWTDKAAENNPDILFIKASDIYGYKRPEVIIALIVMVDGVVFVEDSAAYEVAAVMNNTTIYPASDFVKEGGSDNA